MSAAAGDSFKAVDVTGLRETLAELKALDDKVRKKYLRKAGRDGLKPMLAAARSTVGSLTGAYRLALRISSGRGRPGQIRMTIGASSKKLVRDPKKKGHFYPTSVEFGHAVGKRDRLKNPLNTEYRDGRYVGARKFVQGRHWIKKTYTAQREAALSAWVQSLTAQLAAHQKGAAK